MVYDLCVYFRTGNHKGLTESGSGELGIIVCGRVPWLYQYWPDGFMLLLDLSLSRNSWRLNRQWF